MTIIIVYCPVCVPSAHGDFNVFCILFLLPNVGQGYNEHYSLYNCNSLSANLPSDLCLEICTIATAATALST